MFSRGRSRQSVRKVRRAGAPYEGRRPSYLVVRDPEVPVFSDRKVVEREETRGEISRERLGIAARWRERPRD